MITHDKWVKLPLTDNEEALLLVLAEILARVITDEISRLHPRQ